MRTILHNGTNVEAGVTAVGGATGSAALAHQLNHVKQEVYEDFQDALGANDQLLRLAIIEADALARQTEYPHLVFPLLASEKAHNAARWQFRQQFLLRSNQALAA